MNAHKGKTAVAVSADDIKQTLPGYNPRASHLVHRESTRIADRQFFFLLKDTDYNDVVLMSGGSASGKTEYIETFLLDEEHIIFDGTLPTVLGASIKIKQAQKYKKNVSIHAVIPDDLRRAYLAFLGRERQYEDIHFFRTHSDSRRTLLNIASAYPDMKITLIESSYRRNMLRFEEFIFPVREDMIEFLESIQYTESEIQHFVV